MSESEKQMGAFGSSFKRESFILLGGCIFGIVLPFAIRFIANPNILGQIFDRSLTETFWGIVVALLVGSIITTRLSSFPGVAATRYVAIALVVTYAAVALAMWFLRMNYSRPIFGLSFLLCVLWYVSAQLYFSNRVQKKYVYVAYGRKADFSTIANVKFITFEEPKPLPMPLDGVVVDLNADLPDEWERFVMQAMLKNIPVHNLKQFEEDLTGKVELEHLSENSWGAVLPALSYARIKRTVDFIFALLLLPLLLPIVLVFALAIKLESSGNAIFTQDRMGMAGAKFKIYKLRTMRVDNSGGAFTGLADPRITKLGKILRKLRIDELPQIFNIFKGEMSWIGPRPEQFTVAQQFSSDIPFYMYRHVVRPGISGWAQVRQGYADDQSGTQLKLQHDFFYIKNFSFWLDLVIVLKTLRVISTGFGSR
jgi:lipopolysaccharide/colanic/teichoic acid biosynthesis glycosyltransferase